MWLIYRLKKQKVIIELNNFFKSRGNDMQYNDEIYGAVQLDSLQAQLSQAADISQTAHVSQLGLVKGTFAAAEHTRFIHNVGTSILAGKFADALQLGNIEKLTLEAAAILHDMGYTPFSHAAEPYFKERWGYTHEQLSKAKILREGEVNQVLVEHGLNPQTVSGLIFDDSFCEKFANRQRYMKQLIAGDMDVDRIDFLRRDALRTAPFGRAVDYKRLIQSAKRVDHAEFGDIIAYDEDSVAAIQSFFSAYFSMYRAVYYNPRVKADEAFLNKALFLAHDYIWDKFSQHKDDPSRIREKDVIETLLGIPSDREDHLTAKEIITFIFDMGKRVRDVAFFRAGYQPDLEMVTKVYEAFPHDGQGKDPLEEALIAGVDGAREGEILVQRNIPVINGNGTPKPKDVFVKLRDSGMSSSKVVSVDTLVDFTSFTKERRHRHALRVLTIRDFYEDRIRDVLRDTVK
jgi:uncharacterized protein